MKNFIGDDYKEYRVSIVLEFISAILKNITIILLFIFFNKVFQNTLVKNDAYIFLLIILAVVIINIIINKYKLNKANEISIKVIKRERLMIGNKFKDLSMKYFTKDKLGEFSSIVTEDLTFLGEIGITDLNEMISNILFQFIAVIVLAIFDYRLALIFAITLALASLYMKHAQKIVRKKFQENRQQQGIFSDATLEYAMGISVIKAFSAFFRKDTRMNKEINKSRDKALEFEYKFIPILVIFSFIISLGVGAMIFFSLYFYQNEANKAYMLLLCVYSLYIFIPALELGAKNTTIGGLCQACLERYHKLQSIESMPIIDKPKVPKSYDIEFNKVSFSYQNVETLREVSFKVKEKQICALVGHSGSGKSTIVNLILRFWDINKGSIKIGSVDIRDMTSETLFSMISVVFQDVYLFNDTIMNNIKFGNEDASEEDVIRVSKMARCHDFIMNMPDGYESLVGEAGVTLSGGEKQRISIARAMLKDAPIILLDESTSSIDPDNEVYIQEAINKLVKDKTVIVIAHKLSSIINSNEILVLEKGKIVERGEHNELISFNDKYSKMWEKHINSKSWKIEV